VPAGKYTAGLGQVRRRRARSGRDASICAARSCRCCRQQSHVLIHTARQKLHDSKLEHAAQPDAANLQQPCLFNTDKYTRRPTPCTLVLPQEAMSFCEDCEDVISMAMSAVHSLLLMHGVDPRRVGR